MFSNVLAVFRGREIRALRALRACERVLRARQSGPFSRDEKWTSRCCHVFVDSLVSFLEALRKRSLEKEKRNKKEHYDEHFCNRCNRRARNISCAQISQGWVYCFGDEPHTYKR